MGGIGIRIENLRKKLGRNQSLDGVSLDFTPRTLHGLIGPEGSGKTTLLRHVIGLLRADEGRILYYDGRKELGLEELRPSMAYMSQMQSLYADLSVAEHLDFFRDLYRIPPETYTRRRAELLHMTRMEPFQGRLAGQLSGGMYKKLGLMCALLQSPSVLMLDEPTTGVDPISRREFWDLIYGLLKSEVLVIITTAYMDEAERCGQVHLIEAGKLLAQGSPREVLTRNRVSTFEELFLRQDRKRMGTESKDRRAV